MGRGGTGLHRWGGSVGVVVVVGGRDKTQEFRDRLSKGESFDDIIEEAFAVVREAAWRVLELRHYDVQVRCWCCLPLLTPTLLLLLPMF